MSAIFGRFNFDGRPVPSSELDSMQQAMAYWGPDGQGTWSAGHVGLGSLRLDNTPESVGDSLPWVCPESGDVITATVRLDNREELLASLSIPHQDRSSIPDSRILLEAYHRWGEACTDRLFGDWVFAVWNARERKLFVARDHHGNTGLYYYSDPRFVAFASSLKGLLALPEVPQRPNPQNIAEILVSWAAMGAPTCYEGILHLPPAHTMSVTPEGIEIRRYWFVENTPELRLGSDEEYLEAFLEVFTEAVRCRLRCSAPVGSTLSGGLDSSSVSVLAARELGRQGQRLAAFSSVPYVESEAFVSKRSFGDETPFIEATARSAGNIDVNYIVARQVSPVAGIERSLFLHDQPLGGAANMYWITELLAEAQRQGLGALLTGQRGNATISWTGPAQPSALEFLVSLKWRSFGQKIRYWQEMTGRSLLGAVKSQIVRPAWIHLRQRVHLPGAPKDLWRDYSAINLELARELDITGQMMQGGYDPTFKPKKDPVEARLQIVAPGTTIVGHIYHEFGAAYNLEVRDPTADPRLMEFCWSVPVGQYVRDGQNKMLIRRAMAGYVPNEVLWNLRKGVQGSDVAQRVFDHRSDIEAALSKVERSELACHYLDLPKMRRVFESVQHRIEPKNREPCVTILLRGLAVGLFLLRFD